MSMNVGKTDQLIRAVIGLALVVIPFTTGLSFFTNSYALYGTAAVGVVILLTSMFRICPLYSLMGIKTCAVKQ